MLRHRLRRETADAHAKLEAELDLVEKLRDHRAALMVLTRLYGLFAGIEPGLDRLLGPAVMAGRHRIEDLRRDLEVMGLCSDEIADLAVLAWEPPATSDEAIGALYVLEGMRLGGRVIGRVVALQEWAPRNPLHFWSDRPEARVSWSAFLRRLDDVEELDIAVRGAVRMFAICRAWLIPRYLDVGLHGDRADDTQPRLRSMGA